MSQPPTQNVQPATPCVTAASADSSGTGASTGTESGWFRVCSLDDLPVGGAKCSDVDGRPIVVFRTNIGSNGTDSTAHELPDGSRLWSLDRICYHMGGPLDQGDIEDLHGSLVVTCPWHRYKIGLSDGAGLYQAAPGHWKSKGIRQRTHHTKVEDGNVIVKLNTDKEEIASDGYNDPDKYKSLQERLARQPTNFAYNPEPNVGRGFIGSNSGASPFGGGIPGGYIRSGHIFAGNRPAAEASKHETSSYK